MSNSGSDVIIGLDLGTKCGWAVLHKKKRIASGRWILHRPNTHRALRWLAFEKELSQIVWEYEPEVIAYERVRRHVGTGAAHVYGGFLASLDRLGFSWDNKNSSIGLGLELTPLEISTWRKAACGRGNVSKLEVMNWAKKRFRYTAKTDDEAEALAVAEAMRRIRAGEYIP